jgi:hypothetical protein
MAPPKKVVLESQEVETAQPGEITFDSIYSPPPIEIETVAGHTASVKGKGGLDPYVQELAFNEEMVEVMVHESTDPNAENPVFTACNGVTQYFFRGQVQTVRRKFLAILAIAKEHAIRTPEYTLADGSRGTKITRTSSLKYPFSVISDPNPRGAAWLKALLQSQT